jgi:hypothetical protein
MGGAYTRVLDRPRGIFLIVEFQTDRAEVMDYAVVLAVEDHGRLETVRVYDSAHGHNEMHRYIRGRGKQPPEVFHRGTLGEGMRAAIEEIKRGHDMMIDGWRRR